MTGTIAVVTDSTACLSPNDGISREIRVVPLQVVIAGVARDETSYAGGDVLAVLRHGGLATTSRPAPERFAHVYAQAAAAGAPGIVSVHLSGRISGTVDSARFAATSAPVPATVVDSRSIGAGLGFAVLAAAAAARAGFPLAEVAAAAARRSAHLRSVFCVTTLEHLRHGGRLGAAVLLSAPLGAKPLMHIVVARLEQLAAEFAVGRGAAQVDVVVQHLDCAERAAQLAQRLGARITGLRSLRIIEVGPVIAAHTGPGLLGVAVAAD